MATKDSYIKLLWARSGGRCAMPVCHARLSADKIVGGGFVLGEMAHIVAKNEDGPRGKSILSGEERDDYSNLILLCPTCHTLIDKDENKYPVEKLQLIKSQHEMWVDSCLSSKDIFDIADNAIYERIIKEAFELVNIDRWDSWAHYATHFPLRWDEGIQENFNLFKTSVAASPFSGKNKEFERSAQLLAEKVVESADIFFKHARWNESHFVSDPFYKNDGHFNPRYYEDHEAYNMWYKNCLDSVVEATKAGNWFAEVVRRGFDPSFLLESGKLKIMYEDGKSFIPEYTVDEKVRLLT